MTMNIQAPPHQWGPGKIHRGEDGLSSERTLCGKSTHDFYSPQHPLKWTDTPVNCKICLKAIETQQKRKQWEEEAAQRRVEREAESREWWAWYDRYLLSPEWQRRRSAVLKRANGRCEGCGNASATQVHHLTYARVGHEMLFDLVAVCDRCHSSLHPDKHLSASPAVGKVPF